MILEYPVMVENSKFISTETGYKKLKAFIAGNLLLRKLSPFFPRLIQVCGLLCFFQAFCLYRPTATLYLRVGFRVLRYVVVKTCLFCEAVKEKITLYTILQYNCYDELETSSFKYLLIVLLVVTLHLGSFFGQGNLL
jgi:hypothetical protein